MSEGEHTIISKIPRERLNQIAGRKLSALAIPVKLGADRETLEGTLSFATPLSNPLLTAPLARARFAVEGHDRMRFVEPPLSALDPVPFYDLERSGALEARLSETLQRRAAAVNEVAARLRALRLEVGLDAARLLARAVAKTAGHAFEILGGPDGVLISRVAPVGGRPFDVPPPHGALRLEEHRTPTDLELWLDAAVPRLEASARGAPAGDRARRTPPPASPVEPTPPPRNALTLGAIAAAFGPDAVLAPNAPLELFQEFQHAGTRYRFVATRDVATAFRGRLIGPSGDVWSDRFDLAAGFPGPLALAASALRATPAAPAEAGGSISPHLPAAPPASEAPVPAHLMPHPGEVWVMNVVVESQTGDEVRYVGTDIDGRPYGAARVLKKAEFAAVFSSDRGGWRLLILVDGVQEGGVLYRQLDPQRQPMGAPRRMSASVLVANFVPEAAAF